MLILYFQILILILNSSKNLKTSVPRIKLRKLATGSSPFRLFSHESLPIFHYQIKNQHNPVYFKKYKTLKRTKENETVNKIEIERNGKWRNYFELLFKMSSKEFFLRLSSRHLFFLSFSFPSTVVRTRKTGVLINPKLN